MKEVKFFKKVGDEIVVGDGSEVPEGFLPIGEMSLEIKNCFNKKDSDLKIDVKCGEVILKKYPIYKQINIDNLAHPYTENDREVKNLYIERMRNIAGLAKSKNIPLDDIHWEE